MVYVVSSRILREIASKKQAQKTTSRKTKETSHLYSLSLACSSPMRFFGGALFLRQMLTL